MPILEELGFEARRRVLARGGYIEIPLSPPPQYGTIQIVSGVPRRPSARIDPHPQGGADADLDTDDLESRLTADGAVVAGGGAGLTVEKSQRDPRKTWVARVTNRRRREALVAMGVTWVQDRYESRTTEIPLRVLNHGLRTALEALSLTVHIDSELAYVEVSPELARLGIPTQLELNDIPGAVQDLAGDINLQTLGVTSSRAPSGRPMLRIFIDFETEGVEVAVGLLELADITAASLVIEIELESAGLVGRRVTIPRFNVTANLGVQLTPIALAFATFIDPLIGGSAAAFTDDLLDWLRDQIESLITRGGISPEISGAISRYVPEVFANLAARGDKFQSLDATADSFIVTHYDPDEPQVEPGTVIPGEELPVPRPTIPRRPIPELEPIGPVSLENLSKINHIVVLMQENRSFDHLLSFLGRRVDGLTPGMRNSFEGTTVTPNPLRSTVFRLSPNHGFTAVRTQLGGDDPGEMSGFLRSYLEAYPEAATLTGEDAQTPLSFFTRDQLPTYAFLAEHYTVCQRWFAAHPGPTQPNRLCTLAGHTPVLTNFDAEDEELGYLNLNTFFEQLEPNDWAYYERDIGFIRFLNRYRLDDINVIPFKDPADGFDARALRGELPLVTFIDPNFIDIPPVRTADDDLAPANITFGQQSIACIYDTLTRSPDWNRTMFVITYDEHGGFFDHVPPPGTDESESPDARPAIAPGGPQYLGVRVPAFVVSPWVPRNVSSIIFDHTSLGRTILLRKFGIDAPRISARMDRANHLGVLLTEPSPRAVPRGAPVCELTRPWRPPRRDPDLDLRERPEDDLRRTMRQFGRPPLPV